MPALARLHSQLTFTAALFCALALSFPALATPNLTAEQQGQLRSAQSLLKKAQANLKSAEDSAGPANKKPSGSRAKLSLMRAGSARSDAEAVKKVLAKLPADAPEVVEVQKQLDATVASIDALEKRLTGGSGPKPAPTGKKLDYRQEKKLKDAQYYLREVEGWAVKLTELATNTKAVEDKDTIDHRIVANGIATMDKAKQRIGLIVGYLQELPADGMGVAQTGAAMNKAQATIGEAEKVLSPLHGRLQRLVHPSTYPSLDGDLKRLQELTRMFYESGVLQSDPRGAAKVVEQASASHAEFVRVVKAYAPLMRQQTELGKRVEGQTSYFLEKYQAFGKAAAEETKLLPGRIQEHISEAEKMANEAVSENKTAYFSWGIPSQLSLADDKLALLKTLDAAAAKTAEEKLTQTRNAMKERQKGLRAQIIATNKLPADRYTGGDKEALSQTAITAWKKEQPDANVLAVRFVSETWERETLWRLQNTTWYRVDRSSLQAQLLVKHDDKLAIIRPVNLWIDHMKGDKMTAFPMDTIKDELNPQRYLPIEKIK